MKSVNLTVSKKIPLNQLCMLDPRELRIGVNVMKKNHKGEYERITVNRHDIFGCDINPEQFKPIELTGDILVGMGFIKDNYGLYYLTKDRKNTSESELEFVLKEMINDKGKRSWDVSAHDTSTCGAIFDGCEFSIIKYVHEIQNIYYSRYKKEIFMLFHSLSK